jgi:hypothetical protein
METEDTERIDAAVLALLRLTLHDGDRAWKEHSWDALDRLHAKGLIFDPANEARSVRLTPAGLDRSASLFGALFAHGTE